MQQQKKHGRFAMALATILVAALGLSACTGQQTVSGTPGSSHSVAPSSPASSAAPSSQASSVALSSAVPEAPVPPGISVAAVVLPDKVIPEEVAQAIKAAVVETFNDILAQYANNYYPDLVFYPGEYQSAPEGVSLPWSVTQEELTISLVETDSQYTDTRYYIEAALPLEQDYIFQYTDYYGGSPQGYKRAGEEHAWFVDLHGHQKASSVAFQQGGGAFRQIEGDRMNITAEYSDVDFDGIVSTRGDLHWYITSQMFSVSFDDLGQYVYYRMEGDTLALENAVVYNEAAAPATWNDETLTAHGQMLFDAFRATCAQAGFELP